MALPHLLKYLYNNGTDEAIRRGKKIHARSFVELLEHDELGGAIVFRVKDDNYSSFYKVRISKYADEKLMKLHCTCPYKLGDICRHSVSSLLRLQEMVDKNLLLSTSIQYDQRHTVIKMKAIDLKTLRLLSSPTMYDEAEEMQKENHAEISKAENERVEATLFYEGDKFPIVIQKNEERNFDTSCKCDETLHPLCEHKLFLFLQLFNEHGANYFESIRNWEKEKNKLLQIYGYNLSDDLTGKFEFIYKDGKPFLKLLDQSIKRVAVTTNAEPSRSWTQPALQPFVSTVPQVEKEETLVAETNETLGLIFNFNATTYPYLSIDAVTGESNEEESGFKGKITKLDLAKFVETNTFSDADKQLFQQIRKLQESELNKFLNRNSPFSGFWENIIQPEDDELPQETKALIAEYFHPKLRRIFEEQELNPFVYMLPAGKSFKKENLQPVELSEQFITPYFSVTPKGNNFSIKIKVDLPDSSSVPVTDSDSKATLLYVEDNNLFLWEKPEDIIQAESFLKDGSAEISKEDWTDYAEKILLPLSKQYKVDFDKKLVKEVSSSTPGIKVQLQEKGDYLLFQPIYTYKGYDTRPQDKESIMLPEAGKILVIKRNHEVEQTFLKKIESLHSSFAIQPETGSLVLKGSEVLKNNWFFLFMDAMKELKIPVFGFEALKNFRFNTSRPNTHIHVSSGMDWFDAKVEVAFGDQKIGIADIKKALANKQSFVQLGDGSLGILPDEWIKKYALLFKVGEGRSSSLRLSKYHMSVIDELYENRNEEELSFALDEKYERLREFKTIPDVEAPELLVPILRPYQLSGFQWLHYLQEVGWGGILADDMGLGKTLQSLTMLSTYKTTNGSLIALVVCPTTLIYNWQNEVKKFTPELTYHIHHGSARVRKIEELTKHDIIITTYGTLRSDIQLFLKINFDYAVLDESQAIKNPASKVTKAATLLNAKNKVCMSGTPLQNNTFDLFAQMNFLNPGLLGSVEAFRNEFATPIDKFGELEQKQHLRRLLLPFILRRTKEQVAKDLPEKTETILFCEMEKEQRKIYDAFRNTYRNKILGTIDEQGIGKSQLTILQGLMKLRQICDSPAILNEEETYPNHSIKLDEITREITENIGEHKALIFSQFLGMLGLIRQKLKDENIPFEYFDGSTSSLDREKAIQNFQNNDECRVFLISLKAGGVGLNLTAADYVYIVDPWWNPAVEQQAIDRTHRIGQTKNIFAYRMICVDTIEDKILQLQEKKKVLARELISDEDGFVKSLTKADVEYLFS